MLRYFYPGKEKKDTQQNLLAGGQESRVYSEAAGQVRARQRRARHPAVTCPPEAPGPPPPPETKFCSALTAIVPRVGVSQNFASGGSSPPPVPAPGPPPAQVSPPGKGREGAQG